MSRLLIILLAVGALLVATNPSRAEFNSWAQNYVVKKIEDEARARGENPNDGSSQFGGAIAGLVIAHMPIERKNYLAFSIYHFQIPNDGGDARDCSILGVAGQFLPLGKC